MDKLEPERESALVDLLDRILVKGVVLHADIIISVADIPLIGLNLRAAIAGIKTMLDYGMMEAWDTKIRNYALEEAKEDLDLEVGEEVIYTTIAFLHSGSGSKTIWKQGYLYMTNTRLILLMKKPSIILMDWRIKQLKKIHIRRETYLGKKREILFLTFIDDHKKEKEVKLLSDDINELISKMSEGMAANSLKLSQQAVA